jgi:hypothetical protein
MGIANFVSPILILILLFFPMAEQGYPWDDQINSGPADPVNQEFLRFVNAKRCSVGCSKLE